ncbi:DNA-3-methyladenine glycosylase [Psychrobacter sp. 1Y11]|uniref:DNA-3-methyladenine glycosylase n=1 Tax=Psychrobacter sp. 1Y11 TaxID=3457446 RepID=UPI003FD5F4EF
MSKAKTIPVILEPSWFARPTCVVAADLIGKVLCRRITDTDNVQKTLRVRITETEAYIGYEDESVTAHLAKGKKGNSLADIMYVEGGVFYVYLTYGVHLMLNLVSGAAESPESVLIRAGFLAEDSERLLEERNLSSDKQLSYIKQFAGPGKLSKRLQIDRALYGAPIAPESGVWVEDDGCLPSVSLRPRIGIDYAGEAADWLLRYVWADHPSLSKK